jgi:2-dehydro-3-deoxyphosphogluconate aldolase/(4S)-4-hydroxy-2-oxoglutarate aldolase
LSFGLLFAALKLSQYLGTRTIGIGNSFRRCKTISEFMTSTPVANRLAQYGVVPVVAIEDEKAALPLADALLQGGLAVVEITFRTAAAADVIRRLVQERPPLLVGAGTVLTPANLEAARVSGAAFAVAPGLNPQLVKEAQALGLPFIPGVATPSEIESALGLGCTLLKFFPAEALGGVAMLEALSAPYKHTGVRFMPSGGVNPGNLESYLKLDTVAAVGGTWLAKKEDLANGNWEEIRNRCATAMRIVRTVRK